MDGGVGGRRVVEIAVVVVVEAGGGGGGGGGGGRRGAGMLRRHIPCSSSKQGCGPEGGSQSRHAKPGCWCSAEARDSRGCDNETTLIDEATKPKASHSCKLVVAAPDESCERHSWRYSSASLLYNIECRAKVRDRNYSPKAKRPSP